MMNQTFSFRYEDAVTDFYPKFEEIFRFLGEKMKLYNRISLKQTAAHFSRQAEKKSGKKVSGSRSGIAP